MGLLGYAEFGAVMPTSDLVREGPLQHSTALQHPLQFAYRSQIPRLYLASTVIRSLALPAGRAFYLQLLTDSLLGTLARAISVEIRAPDATAENYLARFGAHSWHYSGP